MMSPHKILGLFEGIFLPNRVSIKLRRFGGYRQNFQLEWSSMWCSDWAEILCGNISWVEEHPLKILRDLHAWFGRCFRTGGGSWARRARSWDIWHALALSKGTSLGHERDTLVHF